MLSSRLHTELSLQPVLMGGIALTPRDWEEYRGAFSNRYLHPRVTITCYPRIHLNRAAYELLGAPAEVLLLYDRHHRAIGLRATTDASRHGYRVTQRTAAGTYYAVIGSQAFIRHYGINGDQRLEFSHILMEDQTMVLYLGQARRIGPRLSAAPSRRGGLSWSEPKQEE
jgi:hypothetical protein